MAEAAGRARGQEPQRRELECERVLCARSAVTQLGQVLAAAGWMPEPGPWEFPL